jgi:hypothetical protein
MPQKYFQKFPNITYANNTAVNITERATFLNRVYANPNLYYAYDIQNSERPDNIASNYYNDAYMSWILYFTNKIVDPYYQWNMDQITFEQYLVKKYGSLAASQKISYYRNNWYFNQDPISVTEYDNLTSNLMKFYEPDYGNDIYGIDPIQYKRKREDWTVSTNMVVSYSANGSNFIQNEVVNIYIDNSFSATGQVSFSNNSTLVLQHISGNATAPANTEPGFYLYGSESQSNVVYTSSDITVDVIPSGEAAYWSPVTYYEHENEINEKNKSILVLNKAYSVQISNELKKLL